jgi:uncharacterized protein (TIGR03118 family)
MLVTASFAAACGDTGSQGASETSYVTAADASVALGDAGLSGDAGTRSFTRTDLTSDQSGVASSRDRNLVNPWGIAYGPQTAFWVANNGTGTSTLYNGSGQPQPSGTPLVVSLPTPPLSADAGVSDAGADASLDSGASDAGATDAGANAGATDAGVAGASAKPTGIVFNDTRNFLVQSSSSSKTAAARFIFATEDGTLLAWAPEVDQTRAILMVDRSGAAIYKGLALLKTKLGGYLFATNFHAGTVEVFDRNFRRVTNLRKGAFVDPNLPNGYAPFGIQAIGQRIFVTYAQQDKDKEDDVAGQGKGYVNEFDASGRLISRFAAKGTLNAPWAVVRAPRGFGGFQDALLVGNFGDGTINAFDLKSHRFLGQLEDNSGNPLTIDGLWGLTFGNGKQAGKANTLYFTAGPDDESHGLFGSISVAR